MNSEDHKPHFHHGELILTDAQFQKRARRIVRAVAYRSGLPPSMTDDDVYQAVMVKLLNYVRGGGDIPDRGGFLYVVARNVIRDLVRKELHKSARVALDDPPESDFSDRLADARYIETSLLLSEFQKQLNDEELGTLECIIKGYTGSQMAARIGISREAAAQRVSRLRNKLREYLFGTGDTGRARRG